jgi:hypothetical protein
MRWHVSMTAHWISPARDRPDIAGSDHGHQLVEQRYASGHVAALDQRLTLAVPGERQEVALGEALADRGRLLEYGVGRGRSALKQSGEPGRQHQKPAFGTVELTVLDQPLCPRDPAAAAGSLTAQDQGQGKPEPALRGAGGVAPVEVLEVSPLPGRGAVFVSPGEVGRDREPLEVDDVEGRFIGCRREPIGRAGPRPAPEGVASRFEPVRLRCRLHPRRIRSRQSSVKVDTLLRSATKVKSQPEVKS